HTIRIEVTGQRSGASNGANVDVDAFVAAGAVAPQPLRFEDTDPSVVYIGSWTTTNDSRASGNSAHRSTEANAAAQFTFNGASVTWLASTGPTRGRARVLVDGKLRDNIDLYSADERYQQSFRYENLDEGSHVIRVETTASHSGPSSDNVVEV